MSSGHVESVHGEVCVVVRDVSARWRLGRVLRHREKSMREPEELRSLKPPPVVGREVGPLRRYLHRHADSRRYYTYGQRRAIDEGMPFVMAFVVDILEVVCSTRKNLRALFSRF